MRARRLWGWGAAVLIGASAAVATASDEDGKPGQRPILRPTERPGIIDKILDLGSDPTEKKNEKKTPKKDGAKKSDKPAAGKMPSVSPEAAELARQEAALLRRIEVCDKLLEIAVTNNDSDLEHFALELDARARALYKERTARLQAKPVEKDLDDKILDSQLGLDDAVKEPKTSVRLKAPRNMEEHSPAPTKGDDQ
jgi:hypothetical protein